MKFPEQYKKGTAQGQVYYLIPYKSTELIVIAEDHGTWQHVSVSLPNRCPNWPEMCFVKDFFWGKDEVCLQFHPADYDYVNLHNFCLHIWKPPAAVLKALEETPLC